ncbi:hypothetical protein HY572_05425 [Candidatus Micrarchaeota archaeon]|nr:hypothetical protein [Candidatus Micrarchaeota archaeon]
MALQKLFTQIKALFSRPAKAEPQAVSEPVWAGQDAFAKLYAKTVFWKEKAATKANPLAQRVSEPVTRLKQGIDAIARATPKQPGPHQRIAEEHQRTFVAKTEGLHRQLHALVFPDDFDGLSGTQQEFSSILASINTVVKDNRYIYAFFERDVTQFNAAMKELLALDAGLHDVLEPVRAFERQRLALEQKRGDDTLSEQLERVRREKAQLQSRLKALRDEKAASPAFDVSATEQLQRDATQAKTEEQRAANRFYAVLESLEGPLKKYARGKDPGAYANVAEKYLRVKEDFLKDCLLDSEDLEPLLSGLDLNAADAPVAEFRSNRLAWADAYDEAREKRLDLERRLAQVQGPQQKAASLDASIQECTHLEETLTQKEADVTARIASREQEIQEQAILLLSLPVTLGKPMENHPLR